MTGDMVPIDALSLFSVPSLKDRLTELVRRVRELRLDLKEYVCLKYILLLNPGQTYSVFYCSEIVMIIIIIIIIIIIFFIVVINLRLS